MEELYTWQRQIRHSQISLRQQEDRLVTQQKKQEEEFNQQINSLKKQKEEKKENPATIFIKPIELDNDNWLVSPKPDTPEEIEQRKAAERARKKEEEEEAARLKAEQNKPNPAQMSLW